MQKNTQNEFEKKLEDLQKRAEEARPQKTTTELLNQQPKEEENKESGTQVAHEFLATVIAGGILGYAIDRFLNTTPWGMIFFIIMGFVSGVYRANMPSTNDKNKKDE